MEQNAMENDIQKVLLTKEQIHEKVSEVAQLISREYADKNPVIIGVLKGVFMFFADVIREITVPCEIDFMCISSYGGTQSRGRTDVRKDVSVELKDRHVIILEDIFDTGSSLDFTVRHLQNKGPASLKVCTLLDKPARRRPGITLQPDYVGYVVPDEFVVGYGLDYNEHFRNLPYIGILRPEVYEK